MQNLTIIPVLLATSLWCGLAAAGAPPVAIKSDTVGVSLDAEFPRIIAYSCAGATLAGQTAPVSTVELNGKPATCQVKLAGRGADAVEYALSFAAEQVLITLKVTAGANAVELRVTSIQESGPFKVKTLFFPGNALLSFDSTQPDAAIATCLATNTHDQCNPIFREQIAALAARSPVAESGNYFFASAGKLACGLAGNNVVDSQRTAWQVTDAGGVKTCSAWCPAWIYRESDSEITELPCAKVFITADRNGDGRATWQDAAIVYRASMPKPFGHEFVKSTVGENIAMDFASGAQQPFLRILDAVKKINLATDGIGNQVVIKGFSSEGHDSANTEYGGHFTTRAGGLKDFTVLLNEAHKYHARIGIHINASEVYPEAQRYDPAMLQRDANGNPKHGWIWLDQAHMIDKHKDATSGRLYAALDQMRKELPKLDFAYVDTYWENGWAAWKLASKLSQLGLPMYSEGDCCMDPWITWSHARQTPHTIQRFLWYSDRDLFANDAILRGGRSDDDGFMGWQNRHNFHSFIRNTFTLHLPAKFLQHFELLRWEPDKEAVFADDVRVVKTGDQVSVTQQDRLVMTWTGAGANTRIFVPWDPRTAAKIYLWDESGTGQTWQLPPAWSNCKEVCLYTLTDMGRGAETKIQVTGGKVTLTVAKATPYVLYPQPAPAQTPPAFGEGSPVKDPGFDSHGFTAWQPAAPATARIENDGLGNARLILSGAAANAVSQPLSGLVGGKTYLAGVWVQVNGQRTASLNVRVAEHTVSNGVSLSNVCHAAPNDPRTGSNYQLIKVWFTLPKDATGAQLTLKVDAGDANSSAEFDDIRVVETQISPQAAKHWFWEDFEHVDLGGYGPFTCCPGERTHLSETHPPYTNDTISGQFSLKSRDDGRVLRSLPSTIRFKPMTAYRFSCATIGAGHLTAESAGKPVLNLQFPNLPDHGIGRIEGTFSIGKDTESFLSLFRDGGDFIAIDELAIDELGPATAAATTTAATAAITDEPLPGRRSLLEETQALTPACL
jgi:endo-alpha-N-acetylgalactosaminidase